MGESNIIKKFQRLLVECEEGHLHQGTVTELIKVEYVPKDRYATGMIVTGDTGTQRIEFASGQKKYIEDAAAFNIGDEVVVLGKKNQLHPNATIPSIILFPEEEAVVLSKEYPGYKFHGWVDYARMLFIILGSIFWVISLSGDLIYSLLNGSINYYGSLYFSLPFVYWSWIGVFFSFLGFILLDSYSRSLYRGRLVLCDTETWNIINMEITKRFENIKL